MTVLTQLALQKHPDLPNVPLIMDLAKTDEQKQILRLIFARQVMGRPYFAPPGIPADRAEVLRKAFMETMQDKDFLADMAKQQNPVNPITGEEAEAAVAKMMSAPPAVVAKAKAIYE
jgi:hypothetical protein